MATKTPLIASVCLCTAFAAQGSTNMAYTTTIASQARREALCKEHVREMAHV